MGRNSILRSGKIKRREGGCRIVYGAWGRAERGWSELAFVLCFWKPGSSREEDGAVAVRIIVEAWRDFGWKLSEAEYWGLGTWDCTCVNH